MQVLILALAILLVSCGIGEVRMDIFSVNTRYTEQDPALSGDGKFLAFVSNRSGSQQLLVYDLQNQGFAPISGLNRRETIVENPSLSYTGRYICYLTSDRAKPVIALYDRVTKRSQVLTPTYGGWIKNPDISPDGRYIVFQSAGRGQWDIEVLDRGPTVELDIPNGRAVGN